MAETGAFENDIDGFLRHLEKVRGFSRETVRAYGSDLASYAAWASRAGIDPYVISTRELRCYLAEMMCARYSERTVSRHLSALRTLYRWLAHEGICGAGALEALSSPRLAKRLPKTMDDADVVALLETCDLSTDEGVRDRAFLELLYATGARISELSRLDVDDLQLGSMGSVRLLGKGSKERVVPIYAMAVDAVIAYLVSPRRALMARAKSPTADAWRALFVSVRGRRMTSDALRARFSRAVRLAGVDVEITPHAMRHTYATELLSGGADLRSVQELLGHASVETTQIYTHLSLDRLKEAARQAHPRAE